MKRSRHTTAFASIMSIVMLLTTAPGLSEDELDQASGAAEPFAEAAQLSYLLSDAATPADLRRENGQWKAFDRELLIQQSGIYWLKWTITIANFRSPQILRMESLMAYDLFWDDRLLMQNGVPGLGDAEVPGKRTVYVFMPDNSYDDGEHTLLLRVSSEHWGYRGALFEHTNRVIHQLSFFDHGGYEDNIEYDEALTVGFGGANFFVGLYFIIMFFGRRERMAYLLCAICSVAVFGVGILDSSADLYNYDYDWHYPIWLGLAIAVTAIFVLLPLIFLVHFNLRRKAIWIALLLLLATSALVLAPYENIGTWAIGGSLMLSLAITAVAAWHKQRAAIWSAIGLILCAVAMIANANLFYPTFSLLMLLILATLVMQDRWDRENFHAAGLLASQLEAQLLRKNIQPHFLMNSLTNVLEWVEVAPDRAAAFIELLAEEFRLFNRIANKKDISIEEELRLCQLHLDIMGYRLRKSFRLSIDIQDPQRRVPPAVFHTLCENGISHNRYSEDNIVFGIEETTPDSGTIQYRFTTPLEKAKLQTGNAAGSGTGMKYIKSRLAQSFGSEWQLYAHKDRDCWVTDITIPAAARK